MLRLTTRVAARCRVVAARASTEYAFDDAKTTNWPRTKANTIINVVPAGEAHVVERARQPMGVKGPGYWVGVPGLDAIAAVVDTREQTIVVPSPPGILSRDGTGVDAAATANVCIVDAEKARQCLMDPAQKLAELAGLLLQKEVATIAADELALKRETIESSVKHQLATDAAPASWGLEVREFKLAALTGRDALKSLLRLPTDAGPDDSLRFVRPVAVRARDRDGSADDIAKPKPSRAIGSPRTTA